MTTRTKLQTIIVITLALLALPFSGLNAQVNPGGTLQPLGKSIPGYDIIVKKTPGNTNVMRYAIGADGRFSLGTLPEGIYTLTIAVNNPANAKTFYESRSNTARSVTINGVKDGTISAVWDAKQGQLFEVNNMTFKPLAALTFEVTEVQEIIGNIAAFGPKDWPTVQSN